MFETLSCLARSMEWPPIENLRDMLDERVRPRIASPHKFPELIFALQDENEEQHTALDFKFDGTPGSSITSWNQCSWYLYQILTFSVPCVLYVLVYVLPYYVQ